MRRRSVLLAVLTAAAGIELLLRGPVRAVGPGGAGDFAAPYAATRAWLQGGNPYDQDLLARTLVAAGRETGADGRPLFTMSVYPPMTFVPLSALAFPPWRAARATWTVMVTAGVVGALLALARLVFPHSPDGRLAVVGAGLALAPFHTAISRGQPGALAIALSIVALAALARQRPRWAGLALGLAVVLKPQVALAFVLYAAVRREWRVLATSAVVIAAALAIGIGALWLHDVPWMEHWMENLRRESAGGEMDPAGVLASQMVDLRPLLVALGAPSATSMALGIGALLLAIALVLIRRPLTDSLLAVAVLATWSVLVGYHRFYDAALVVLPVAWALRELAAPGPHRRAACVTLAAAIPFLVPGGWMLHRAAAAGVFPEAVSASTVFRVVLLPHQTWALLVMFGALVAGMTSGARGGPRAS